MRLFIAINFPEEVKEDIQKVVVSLVTSFPQVSWVKLDNIHLTLKFLGNVKEGQLAGVEKAIKQSTEGMKPFELKFDKLGYFDRNYLIIWLGIKHSKSLVNLVDKIEKEIAKLGFPREKRVFSSHITLGRGKRLTREFVKVIREKIGFCHYQLPSFSVREISLMQSSLSRSGAIYSSIKRFALV